MRFPKLLMAVAACALATTPAMAAPSASVFQGETARISTETQAVEQDGGFPWLILFATIAVGLGVYFAVDGDDSPTSP